MSTLLKKLKQEMFIDAYLKQAQLKKQQLFADYLINKLNGEKPYIEALTYENLKELIEVEQVTNQQIAFLFDVDKRVIQQKRKTWGIHRQFTEDMKFVSSL